MKKTDIYCPYCDNVFNRKPKHDVLCPKCKRKVYTRKSAITGNTILLSEEVYEKIVARSKTEERVNYFVPRINQFKDEYRKVKMATEEHGPTRGTELERLIRELLEEHLPNKYGVDTGFVKSLEKPGWQSNQVDVLFVRQDICYPLEFYKSFKVYPIEAVIGFMEVTSTIGRGKLTEDFEKVVEMKRLSKRYIHLPVRPAGTKTGWVDAPYPRFYYFAASTNWKDPEIIKKNIEEVCKTYGIQLHALMILDTGCFIVPTPTKDKPTPSVQCILEMPDAFIFFLYHILLNLQTADYLPYNSGIPFLEYYQQSKPKLR